MLLNYRISRILVFIISSICAVYFLENNLLETIIVISILFIIFDLYWPRTDYS